MKLEYYCSEWCIFDAWDNQLAAEVVELEQPANCSYCDAQLLQGFSYFETDLQLTEKMEQYAN